MYTLDYVSIPTSAIQRENAITAISPTPHRAQMRNVTNLRTHAAKYDRVALIRTIQGFSLRGIFSY